MAAKGEVAIRQYTGRVWLWSCTLNPPGGVTELDTRVQLE